MDIIWKDIPGYERLYQASNTGLIKSVERAIPRKHGNGGKQGVLSVRERILAPRPDGKGYGRVLLYKDKRHRQYKIHQLVILTFEGPKPQPNLEVRHLDGNNKNNHIDNLRYGTQKENAEDRVRHGSSVHVQMLGDNARHHKLRSKDVIEIRTLIASGKTKLQVSKMYNVSAAAIYKIINRETWAHVA